MKTKCCNALFVLDESNDNHGPIFWNDFNQVVQCHHCGEQWEPQTQLKEAEGAKEAFEYQQKNIDLFKEYERRVRIKVNRLVNCQNYENEEKLIEVMNDLLAFVNGDIEKLLALEETEEIKV